MPMSSVPSFPSRLAIAWDSLTRRIIVVTATVLVCHQAAFSSRFIAPPTYPTGGVPQQIIPADVNRDGILDLITSNDNGEVSVLLGKSGGTFAGPTVVFGMDGGAPYIAVADFNGDGIPDIAAVLKTFGTVEVFQGNGNGTFTAVSNTATFASPVQIAVDDVNGDNRPDVIAVSATALSTLFGNGNGTFRGAINTPISVPGFSLAVGDLNGDGRLDVFVGCGGGSFSDSDFVFTGSGDGHFSAASQIPTPALSESQVMLADLDGDHNTDIIVASLTWAPLKSLYNMSVRWGDGHGGFSGDVTYLPSSFDQSSVVIGDFNQDGKPDIASSDGYTNSVTIIYGQGARRFGPVLTYTAGPFPNFKAQPGNLAAADMNGDGRLDLAAASPQGIQILRNVGGGRFYAPTSLVIGPTEQLQAFATDVDRDGHTDLVVEAQNGYGYDSPYTFFGDGTGRFPRAAKPLLNSFGTGIALGDFDHDGKIDLAYQDLQNNAAIFVLLYSGGAAGEIDNITSTGSIAADLNGDGYSDIAVPDSPYIDIYLNNRNGTFSGPTSVLTGPGPLSLVAADVNKDGKKDLISTDSTGMQIVVLLGKGDGTFQTARYLPVTQAPSGIAVGDFDRDGKLDLAIACANSVQTLIGHGDGTFTPNFMYSIPGGVQSLHQADLRHDGLQDLVFVDGASLLVMYGNRNGTFEMPTSYWAGANPRAIAIGEFNEDGAPDVFVVNGGSMAMTMLFNLGGRRIALKSSASSAHVGAPITFTATVSATVFGAGTPSGTVAFKDGSKAIGIVHLAGGKATFTTAALGPGTHQITASYWETSSTNPGVSAALQETILP